MYSHLAQLDLTDVSDGNSRLEIDILVGCDCYWDVVPGQPLLEGGGQSSRYSDHTGMGTVRICEPS